MRACMCVSKMVFVLQELHAHLSGSVSSKTIQHLFDRRKQRGDVSPVDLEQMTIAKKETRTLDE